MKHKKWKWNYYIIAFIVFIFMLFFIDLYLEGSVAEYFVRQLLEDREEVILSYSGHHAIRGTFRWDRLRRILTFMAISGFLIVEVSIYFASKIYRNREKEKVLIQVEERLRQFKDDKSPAEVQELRPIDVEIKSILNEKIRIEQEKEMEIQKKNDLVTYLAHDLKTPLTAIIGYLSILEESQVPEKIQKDYLKKILDKAYHLEELTNQFFDITRFNLQEIPLNKTEFDGEFFLQQITDEFYPLCIPKKLQIDLNISPNFKIYGDGGLLARVLNNILKNAISYSNKNSVIKITGKEEGEIISITAENHGDVISNQELELIFQKFYRRDKARSQSSGSGLGLAIAKEIVERHGGTLKAESINGHTTFSIHLLKSL
ncbi:HAMP domain-containing histidine kinase [Clostridium botulinum]|uniref:histidine kinase n=1 Tax=Clostridium botulinum TaxID=1491 RepID=A0A846JDL4_CLOBO|nr:HAMP domain-containing sensor histidine kinase [Clostridium botulinum]NFH64480.1 HAMP domain-containing histidine kinase [Clostridium botulinum]NFJ08214.1 HAMP domain-containing histidine kinase [Clostridium botulinum]NFK15980.1 HAMP domain-containing histidine kinase [Clostridium botulinum]NFM93121.1 HAMP domain-containing histidine kinase [Clostridium botulinum]NFO17106.1 HAMP domain-containing histidine kinase [Clostridium botulinum]